MKKLVLHPTGVSQWQTLVKEANATCHEQLSEELESYLVFLLMRVSSNPDIVKKVMSLDFLESANAAGKLQEIMRKDVGDNCLIFSGLFPGQARRRRVNISYFVKLGQTAYSSIADHDKLEECLFKQLSDNFVLLMDILHCMRELDQNTISLDLLEAAELWCDTGSKHAKKVLDESTDSRIIHNYFHSNGKH